jgi:hypothetical protein
MLAMTVLAVPMAMLGLDPSLVPVALGFLVAGAAVEIFGVGWSTALHEHVPLAVLSRVSSYDALGSFVAMPVGTFLYGWLASVVDLETLLVGSAVVYIVVALSALLSRSVRDLSHDDASRAADGSSTTPADGQALEARS